jgi:hypothetical protein
MKMLMMHVHLDATGMLDGVDVSKIIRVREGVEIGCLPRGMASGKASVEIICPLPDGKILLLETSLAVLQATVNVFTAKYGMQHDGIETLGGDDVH